MLTFTLIESKSLITIKQNYFVVGSNINLRNSYGLKNSKVISQLNYGDKVQVFKIHKKLKKINNKTGLWVFVKTEYLKNDKEIQGWIFSTFLAAYKDFKKVKSFYNFKLDVMLGDWKAYFYFKNDGSVIREVYSDSKGKWVKSKSMLYKYHNLYSIIDDEFNNENYFFLNKDLFYFRNNGKFCYRINNGKENCSKKLK